MSTFQQYNTLVDQAEFIRQARNKTKLSQSEFAAFVGRHTQTISNYERGLLNPSREFIEKCKKIIATPDLELEAYIEAWQSRRFELRGV